MSAGVRIGSRGPGMAPIVRATRGSGAGLVTLGAAAAVLLFVPLPGAASLADMFR